jgi:hypothetical protein
MVIAFYKGRSRLFNRLVSWYCRGRYSHCELIIDDSPMGTLCASSSFMDGGVRMKVIKLDPERWDKVSVGGDSDYAMAWLTAHLGCGYDVRGLLGFVWRRGRDSRTKWFCSEAVAAMLGIPDPWRFDPCSLAAAHHVQP